MIEEPIKLKKLVLALVLVLSASVFVHPQNCSDKDKERARSISQKIEFGSPIRYAVEHDKFGDCVHYAWMDEMQKLGIKRVDAVVKFVWKDEIKKIEITKISFRQTYDNFGPELKDKKIMKEIETGGLKKQLEAEILERAKKHVFAFIEDLKKPKKAGVLGQEPKGEIKGTLLHHLLDDGALPISMQMGIIEL